MSIHWSCMHPLEILRWLQTFPISSPKFERSYQCIDGLCIPCFSTLVSMQQVSWCLEGSLRSLFGFEPFAPVSWRLEESSLVDKIKKFRVPSFLVPDRFFSFIVIHRIGRSCFQSSFRHGTNHHVLTNLRKPHEIEKAQKVIPFIFRKTTFGQNVCWIFGSRLIRSNNQSRHTPHCRTSPFDNHFDHGFVVFKDVQLRFTLRRMCVGAYIVHFTQVLNLLSSFSHLGLESRTASVP